jgi:nucleoid-associated protein YgaU
MKAFAVVMMLGMAAMLAAGCNQSRTEVPPLETTDVAPPVKGGPVIVEPLPPKSNGGTIPITSGTQTYTVKAGDTLYSLAKRFYGDGKLWTKIADANKDKVRETSTIPVGTLLVIPAK